MTPLLRYGVWLAMCDGGKAMLLENVGDQFAPKFEMRELAENANPRTCEWGTAPPGRVFSGSGRHATMEQTDFHDEAEKAFLARFAARINQLATNRRFTLILIAPPRALGMLRPHLTEAARASVLAEVPRDYVRLPLYEIERKLAPEA